MWNFILISILSMHITKAKLEKLVRLRQTMGYIKFALLYTFINKNNFETLKKRKRGMFS